MLRKPNLVFVLALGILLVPGGASALGLGGMRTQSALNQPFFAEIDLFDVASDELDSVKVRLAGRDEFDKAGAERPHFLTRLNFVPMIGPGGRPIVQVTSRDPIREPYLDFLVEVLWPGGRLVKEYTVLMDLPGSGGRAAPRLVQPQTSVPVRRPPPQPAPRVRAPEPAAPRRPPARSVEPSSPAQPVVAAPEPEPSQGPDQAPAEAPSPPKGTMPPQAVATSFPINYTVPSGLGLWRVARRLAPPGATVEQTAMALYRNNQDAFVRGDINRLMVAANLSIPSAEELFALDAAAARREFQDALAGRSVTSEPLVDTQAQSELRIAAPADSPTVTDESAVRPAAEGEGAPDLEEDLLLVREASESNRQETTELRNRVLELEGQLEDIRRLLQLRNEQLAQLQQVARDDERVADSLTLAEPGAAVSADVSPSAPVEEVGLDRPRPIDAVPALLPSAGAEADLVEEETARAAAESAAGSASAVEPGAPTPEPAVAAGEAEAEAADADVQLEPGAQLGTEAAPGQESIPATPEPVGVVGSVLRTVQGVPPWALAAGGGGLLVGALGLLALRRRRQMTGAEAALPAPDSEESGAGAGGNLGLARGSRAEFGDDLALDLDQISDSELGDVDQSALADAAAGDSSREIALRSGLPSSAAALSYRQPETQETDIIAEADIYLLYGRYREAETILQEEIRNAPARSDLKYKLAEAYIGSGNVEALTALADQMRAAGDDSADPAKWAQISQSLAAMSSAADVDRPSNVAEAQDAPAASGLDLASGAALWGPDRDSGEPLDDSDDSELGFSVHEMTPADADEVQQKLADLELDLQGMDGLEDLGNEGNGNRDPNSDSGGLGTGSAAGGPDLASEIGMLDAGAQTWKSTPLYSEPRPRESRTDKDTPAQWPSTESEDLDLDLDALRTFGQSGEPTPPRASSLSAADRADSDESPHELDGGATLEQGAADDWAFSQGPDAPAPWDESATKMDLARAYIEMDDPAAARSILEEVLQEGSDAQQAEAKALIETLD